MNALRTAVASLGLVVAAGVASGPALAKNFHIHDPSTKTELLDRCAANICAKVTTVKGDTIRIKLQKVNGKEIKFFRVTFVDDVTGKLTTKIVFAQGGSTGFLGGLTAEKGKIHSFTVEACFKFFCSPVKAKFGFKA